MTNAIAMNENELNMINGGFEIPVLGIKINSVADAVKYTLGQIPGCGSAITGSARIVETWITGGEMGKTANQNLCDVAEEAVACAGGAAGALVPVSAVAGAAGFAAKAYGQKVIDFFKSN